MLPAAHLKSATSRKGQLLSFNKGMQRLCRLQSICLTMLLQQVETCVDLLGYVSACRLAWQPCMHNGQSKFGVQLSRVSNLNQRAIDNKQELATPAKIHLSKLWQAGQRLQGCQTRGWSFKARSAGPCPVQSSVGPQDTPRLLLGDGRLLAVPETHWAHCAGHGCFSAQGLQERAAPTHNTKPLNVFI